ncbi:hypothetical protein KC909_01205 [Candidatus Dojkabacteria bacterium]|uniref:Uncharacterized protein n=1 Tax=Candidatus Dojkabacteria bacterium TaxID=2099670 RepID=A0A955L5E1_9BACT|nr:hypothetical protein [Candidatus Dojkabacteria bacterium]
MIPGSVQGNFQDNPDVVNVPLPDARRGTDIKPNQQLVFPTPAANTPPHLYEVGRMNPLMDAYPHLSRGEGDEGSAIPMRTAVIKVNPDQTISMRQPDYDQKIDDVAPSTATAIYSPDGKVTVLLQEIPGDTLSMSSLNTQAEQATQGRVTFRKGEQVLNDGDIIVTGQWHKRPTDITQIQQTFPPRNQVRAALTQPDQQSMLEGKIVLQKAPGTVLNVRN